MLVIGGLSGGVIQEVSKYGSVQEIIQCEASQVYQVNLWWLIVTFLKLYNYKIHAVYLIGLSKFDSLVPYSLHLPGSSGYFQEIFQRNVGGIWQSQAARTSYRLLHGVPQSKPQSLRRYNNRYFPPPNFKKNIVHFTQWLRVNTISFNLKWDISAIIIRLQPLEMGIFLRQAF